MLSKEDERRIKKIERDIEEINNLILTEYPKVLMRIQDRLKRLEDTLIFPHKDCGKRDFKLCEEEECKHIKSFDGWQTYYCDLMKL